MKLIIAGGRNYSFTELDKEDVSRLIFDIGVTEIVSGGAPGADRAGEEMAQASGVPVKMFSADWDVHGRAAGPIRNREMAEYADAVALFPGGAGTESMKNEAYRAGIQIFDFR